MKRFAFDRIGSPIGEILIATDGAAEDAALVALDFDDCEARMRKLLRKRFGAFDLEPVRDAGGVARRLRRYLGGELDVLDAIRVQANGSAFQERAWAALREIRPGKTASYGEQANRLGQPSAARAVGLANSLNPVAIVVPCHRVIGADGMLTGFAGGIERKRWLLTHERAAVATGSAPADDGGSLSLPFEPQ